MGKIFHAVKKEVYKAVDMWLMDRQSFGITKFEGSVGWHHTLSSSTLLFWNVKWPGLLYFLCVLVAKCVIR
jgi:hypothetical protein